MIVKCQTCGKDFKTYPSWIKQGSGKHCSRACSDQGEKHEVKCLICEKSFTVYQHRIDENRGKFCSKPCFYKYKSTLPAWNKGKPAPWSIGNKHRLGKTNPNPNTMIADENPKWKGEDVGYHGLHNWVRNHLGTPRRCDHCGNKKLRHRQYHWANKSQKYLRDLNDWIRLCAKCHKAYDSEMK